MSHFTFQFASEHGRKHLRISQSMLELENIFELEMFIVSGSLSLRFVYLCLSTKLKLSTKNGLQFLYSHHS